MSVFCLFCGQDVSQDYIKLGSQYHPNSNTYICARCGIVRLTHEAASDFPASKFSETDKDAISITLRNEWEKNERNPLATKKQKTAEDLRRIVELFRPLSPLEKIDNALSTIDKGARHVGRSVFVNCYSDYPYYYCKELWELDTVLHFAAEEGLIIIHYSDDPQDKDLMDIGALERLPIGSCGLTTKGYQRLLEIQQLNQDSNQCFVAMWFAGEMNKAFDEAIAPAIEYVEPGEENPRFKAVRIKAVIV